MSRYHWSSVARALGICAACIVVTALAWIRLSAAYPRQYFFVDEHEFLRKSYFYDLLFVKRDLTDPRWYSVEAEGGAAQPKVGVYIYGMALHLSGVDDIEREFDRSGFNRSDATGTVQPWWFSYWMKFPFQFDEATSRFLPYLWTGRRTAVLFAAGAVALAFLTVMSVAGPVAATITALLIGRNRLFLGDTVLAMTDGMQLFWFFLNLLILRGWLLSVHSPRWRVGAAAAMGVVTALAAGTKVTGMLAFIMDMLFMLTVLVVTKPARRDALCAGIGCAVMCIAFAVVFWLLHPFIHANPAESFPYMFTQRLEDAKTTYTATYPVSAVPNRYGAYSLIVRKTLFPGGAYTNFPGIAFPLDYGLFITGFVLSVIEAAGIWWNRRRFPAIAIIPVWTAVVLGFLVWYLHNDWSRYYLPWMAAVCMIEAYAMARIVTFVRRIAVRMPHLAARGHRRYTDTT